MKTKEELQGFKKEIEELSELSEDNLEKISGGTFGLETLAGNIEINGLTPKIEIPE